MNQKPNHKRDTKRHLFVETMETRLMLSISPAGPGDLQYWIEVEYVPPATQGTQQLDLLDFSDMAEQFNHLHVAGQVSVIAPLPQLPQEDSSLDLRDPSTFLSTASTQSVSSMDRLADRLADELTSIDWNTTDDKAGGALLEEVFLGFRNSLDNLKSEFNRNRETFPGDTYTFYFSDSEGSLFGISLIGGPGDIGKENDFYNGMVDTDECFFNSGYVYNSNGNLDFQKGFADDFGRGIEIYDIGFNGAFDIQMGIPATPMSAGLNYSSSAPAPPMAKMPNIHMALQATASAFYQEMFDSSDTSSNDMRRQSLTAFYDSLQSSYLASQSGNDEGGTYEEDFLLSELGGSDGSTTELDSEQLAILESQAFLDMGDLEIEGLMNTDPEELLVDDTENTGEDGGTIDFTYAMNWSNKPVASTPEGIVQASVQQDDKVVFEGSYGRGQTFELATVEEEEAAIVEDPNVEEVSAALQKALNEIPLNDNSKENLDKTDTTPTAHEMALGQVTGELDYASLLPSDALSWATFAFVGQQITRHPDERKKKEQKKPE